MPDKFDKFTERARKVLNLAQEEAHRFNRSYIGPEHILLGLVREGDGVAARVLANLGVELHKVRAAVEFHIERGKKPVIGDIGLTSQAKRVIELAVNEAKKLNHHYIGTEHLLLGLVREGEGIAASVLESLDVNSERVRAEVLNVLNASGSSQPSHSETQPDNFGRLSADAQHVLILAQQEASRLGHRYIGAEHILLGIVAKSDSVAAQALIQMGLDLAEVGMAVEEVIGKGEQSDKLAAGHAGLTPRAARVIALALKEAQRQGREYVGSEDLLIALFREADQSRRPDSVVTRTTRKLFTGAVPEGEGIAAGVLTSFGASATKVQATLEEIYGKAASVDWNDIIASDRFTEQAQQVMKLAGEEAHRFNHNYIGTEHVLLGLIRVGDTAAAQVLANLKVELHKVRSAAEFIIGPGERLVEGDIGLTPRAKKVLELSVDEARRFGQTQIGPEHILLGLVREGEGIAAGVLESLGVSLERVRMETVKVLRHSEASSEPVSSYYLGTDVITKEQLDQAAKNSDIQFISTMMADVAPIATLVRRLAKDEALRLGHIFAGTEHILLALLHPEVGLAAQALSNVGVTLEEARKRVETLRARNTNTVEVQFTQRANLLGIYAISEAIKLHNPNIGSEHYILGLMTLPDCLAATTLRNLGVTLEQVRDEVMKLIKETNQDE